MAMEVLEIKRIYTIKAIQKRRQEFFVILIVGQTSQQRGWLLVRVIYQNDILEDAIEP